MRPNNLMMPGVPSRVALTLALLGVVLNGCVATDVAEDAPGRTRHSASSSPVRPLPEPTVIARSAPPLKEHVPPEVQVSIAVDPMRGLTIGDRITMTLTIREMGFRKDDLPVFAGLSTQVAWRIEELPKGADEETTCRAFYGREACFPRGFTLYIPPSPQGTRSTIRLVAAIEDFACPGGGDFLHPLVLGVSGPVAYGPNTFHAYPRFENDRDDYIEARARQGSQASLPSNVGCRSESLPPV